MEVREGRQEDAAALAVLLDELGYPTDAQRAKMRLERLAADPASQLLVAEEAGNLLGAAGLHVFQPVEHDAPVAVLTALVTGSGSRRRGVGSRLVAAIEREARARGCFEILVSSAERRADAHAFYESLGYERTTSRRYVKRLPGSATVRC